MAAKARSVFAPVNRFGWEQKESYVNAEARYAARERDGHWFTVLQVRHDDGRWYSRLSTQRPAQGERDARTRASIRANQARDTRRWQDGD